LEVHNSNGSITVTAGTGNVVDVYAEKISRPGGSLKNVEILVTTGSTMIVETKYLVKYPRVSVTYKITVPENIIVKEVTSSDGSLAISGTQGDLLAKTSDGSIRFEDIQGAVNAKTSDGSITGNNVTGTVNAKTSDGGLTLKNVTGAVTAKTSDGSITVEEVRGETIVNSSDGSIQVRHISGFVDAKTSDGSITVKDVSGIIGLRTSDGSIIADVRELRDDASVLNRDGSITLYLARDLNAELEMKTRDGKIVLHDVEILTRKLSNTSLVGTFGEGGYRLEVGTSDGNINVHLLP
jgi:hypothetical protein